VGRWLDAADVVVCPLRIGGGVKVKILEALARGCAIVTTPIGMQGLRYLPGNAVVECRDLSAVADACAQLLASPARREQLRERAAQAATLLPTWDEAAAELDAAWTTLAAASPYAATWAR
jgi:glycosyltransferase involved in cell wall biosynthesis